MNNRLSLLKNLMANDYLDAALISSVPNITYLTGFSHFSLTEREAFLFIVEDKNYILTDGRYSEAVKTQVANFELVEISSNLSFQNALKKLARKHKVKKTGIEEDNLTVSEHKRLSGVLNDLNHLTHDRIRSIKTGDEILAIEKACGLGDKTFKHILNKV